MNYKEARVWLDQHQFFKIKLGLETTAGLLAELGNPQDQLKIIHIAGTNGKGSVGATLLSILSTAGYRTGLYASPHLSSVRERFRIGDTFITETDFARLVTRLADFLADRPTPTYFECTTILALLWFQEQQTDVVLLETGMGGRLDATNVVTPILAVITDISRDHEQYLGTTLTAIAAEKAGIIKPRIPVIFSGRAAEAVAVIEQRCRELDSPLFLHGRDFAGTARTDGAFDYQPLAGAVRTGLPLALGGVHQVINTSLALAALEQLNDRFPVPSEALTRGLQQVRWPGRMELMCVTRQEKTLRFLLDGAHNEAGVRSLCQSLIQGYPRRRLVLIWGNMADKSMEAALLELLSLASEVIFTRAESQRSADPAVLHAQLPPAERSKAHWAATVEQALSKAIHSAGPEDLILVAGSLYLVGRIRQLLVGGLAE
jgi:dihydrofolate synthase/folylpolyglutamate synthase